MSFINSTNSAYVYAKLTNTGRKALAKGALTYNYWVFGDSEIDYGFENQTTSLNTNTILAPKDKNPNIKYPIPFQLNGNIFNTLPAINPIELTITNVAKTRGFFTGSTVNPQLLKGSGNASVNGLLGGKTIFLNITLGTIAVGDLIMIGLKNPTQTNEVSDIPVALTPHLMYTVEATNASTGTATITVDRNLPNFNGGTGATICKVFVFPGGESIKTYYGSATTTPYWNKLTLSFESTCGVANDDVPVWNLSIVYTQNIAGIDPTIYAGLDEYDTKTLAGFKEYLNYTSANSLQKSIGIVHYSNNSISNFYGESLKSGQFEIKLPTVIWHKNSTPKMGLTLKAKVTTQNLTTDSSKYGTSSIPFNVKYDYLVDENDYIVGKVFYELKLAVIEDEELLAAISYKSNRNWSLPSLNGTFTAASTDSAGLIGSNQEVYVSYLLANETGYGYATGLHCQNYIKIGRGGTSQNNIRLNLPVNQLGHMKSNYFPTGGFTADKFYVLVQKVNVGQKPLPNAWKKINMTSTIQGHVSGNINSVNLEGSTFTIDLALYNAAPTYVLNDVYQIAGATENKLNFGDEKFLLGNVDAQIQAVAYKSSFTFTAPSAQFNNSLNPTFNQLLNSAIYFSEIGIYNNLKELVAIGKVSRPIKKESNGTVLIQLEIDF